MRRAMAVVLVGLVATGSVAFTGIALAGGASPTKVTIEGPDGDFSGRILSDDRECLGDRTVKVFMEASDGSWDKIASDTSERRRNRGVWSVGNTGQRDGRFYARATKAPGCRAGKSEIIELVNGEPQ
jgi:hypothetical protein